MTARGAYKGKAVPAVPRTLGERIRKVRQAWGWSQKTLAEAIHADQQLISDWERDRSKPSGASLAALAKALHLTPKALEVGDEFKVPAIPGLLPSGSFVDRVKLQELVRELPETQTGEALVIDMTTLDSDLTPCESAIDSLSRLGGKLKRVYIFLEN